VAIPFSFGIAMDRPAVAMPFTLGSCGPAARDGGKPRTRLAFPEPEEIGAVGGSLGTQYSQVAVEICARDVVVPSMPVTVTLYEVLRNSYRK
jgi:hypothetical protein